MGLWFWFRAGEIHLRGPDGAADGAVTDELAPQFGVYTGNELVAVRSDLLPLNALDFG
jgi:hypothetical protein